VFVAFKHPAELLCVMFREHVWQGRKGGVQVRETVSIAVLWMSVLATLERPLLALERPPATVSNTHT
jgi:hypothetical protein